MVQDRGGGPGDHHAVLIVDGDDIVAPEGLDNLGKQADLIAAVGALGVVDQTAGIIGDQKPGHLQVAQGRDGRPGGSGVEHLLLTDGAADQEDLVHHGIVLAPVKDLLTGFGGVEIQKQQHQEGQHHIDRSKADLIAAIAQRPGFIF